MAVFGGKVRCWLLPPNPEAILPVGGSLKLQKRVGFVGWVFYSIVKVRLQLVGRPLTHAHGQRSYATVV